MKYRNTNYITQKINYKNQINSIKRENIILFIKRRKKKKFSNSKIETSKLSIEDTSSKKLINKEDKEILKLIEKLDTKNIQTFQEEFYIDFEPELSHPEYFLYHGLRFQKDLEKLEGILKERKILAGKYLNDYYYYSDNCNEGDYVSLARYSGCIEFETFVRQNMCLVVSPFCDAKKTIYVPYNIWNYIKVQNISVKNRYSYSNIEYQVKDFIPIEMIKAIGIPYSITIIKYGTEFCHEYIQKIINLLNNYNINIPIIDINNYGKIIYSPIESEIKNKILKRY